jgi:hypothetical protein
MPQGRAQGWGLPYAVCTTEVVVRGCPPAGFRAIYG